MSELTNDIIKTLPKWMFTVAFCIFVVFMVISLFSGTFKIGGFEFGFNPKPEPKSSVYIVRGTVETMDRQPPQQIVISPRHPPLHPSGAGDIVGLKVSDCQGGEFPILNFSLPGYWEEPLDLNDKDKVEVKQEGQDQWVIIKKPIVLKPKPPGSP